MQEHLIPQDISNYKFHLIGELDLKQFGEVMAGIIVGVIINQMGWPDLIKWPLIIISVGVGLVAAFVPLGGQPLTHWLTVFIKALFSPTKYYWRKETVIPSYFTYELPARNREFLDANSTFNDTPARKHKALMYFSTLSGGSSEEEDPLERFNDARIAKATEDFTYAPAPVVDNVVAPKKMISKPMVGNEQSVRQRQILTPTQESLDAFLETSSIFQPTQILEEITAVDDKMANSDSTLAAALDEGPPAVDPFATAGNVNAFMPVSSPVLETPISPIAPAEMPIVEGFESVTPITQTTAPAVNEVTANVNPVTPEIVNNDNVVFAHSTSAPAMAGITMPENQGIILPTMTTPIAQDVPPLNTTSIASNNSYLNSEIALPDLSATSISVAPITTQPTTPETPALTPAPVAPAPAITSEPIYPTSTVTTIPETPVTNIDATIAPASVTPEPVTPVSIASTPAVIEAVTPVATTPAPANPQPQPIASVPEIAPINVVAGAYELPGTQVISPVSGPPNPPLIMPS